MTVDLKSRKALLTVALWGTVAFSSSGCENISDTLGFGRNPPDEFAVVDRPPLSMPPDFALRPPQPGAPRPQETNMTQRAGEAVFGKGTELPNAAPRGSDKGEAAPSDGEQALLSAAEASRADPAIRDIIDREAAKRIAGSRHLADDLLWWRKPDSGATVVNAADEADRLRAAREDGAPVNKGATPTIERQKGGWLEW